MSEPLLATRLASNKLLKVTELLEKFGWSPERKVDTSGELKIYEENGWHVFPKAEELLEIFSGMEPILFPARDKLFLADHWGDEDPDVAIDWKAASGEDILPIGSYDLAGLYIETSGKIYGDAHCTGLISLFGYDIYEAIYNLFFGEPIQDFTYEFTT